MRKQHIAIPALGLVLLAGLTGCSKKLGQFKSEYFTTDPTPLETVGDKVPAVITANIPPKFMVKNAQVTVTPVIKWEGGSVESAPSLIQGEEARANGQAVSYTNGGTVRIPFNVNYQPAMAQSELYLNFNVDQNGKQYVLPQVKVGYGVIATSTLASAKTVAPAIAKDKFQKVITENYSADIHFLINQANIRANQTSKSDYIDLNKKLIEANSAKDKEIASVTINSFASPEGSLEFNTQLAEKREKNTTNLMENQLKKDKITEFGELTSSFTPEDWEGFKKLVEKSNIQDKELILGVLSMYPDPEKREKEIRNLSSVFNELAEQILPQLRYSRVQATINVLGKSDEELISLYNSNPDKLTVDEMLYIATLTDDNMKKMEIYNKAAETFPNDYRTYNNLGAAQFAYGDYDAARANIAHAGTLNPGAKEVEMNQGLFSLIDNDMQSANAHFGAASGVPELNDALGVYYLSQGDVNRAVSTFGNARTNNAALAKILAHDYSGAQTVLSEIVSPDATTYYLTAVLGARTGNDAMVMSNLRQAIQLNRDMRARAKADMEFAKFNLGVL